MSQNTISSSLLNIVLVLVESLMTFILRLDSNLRKAMYPLAKKNTIVCIRTYLPHIQFYASFTTKGLLLDSQLPIDRQEADVVINAYSHQLINSLISNDVNQVQKITMRGSTEAVTEVRNFLVQLGLASLFQSIIKTIKGNKNSDNTTSDAKNDDTPDYKERIEKQQKKISALTIRNRELELTVKEVKSKQKLSFIGFLVASVIAIVAIVGWAL